MTELTGPLKWHGGKHYLARRIVALMPRHLHYVEPYAGGLAVLLERDPNDRRLWADSGAHSVRPPAAPAPFETAGRCGVSEVANDLDGRLINFWEVLKWDTPFLEFARLMEATPLSREVFDLEAGHAPCGRDAPRPCVRCAAAFFVACRQSRAGTFRGFTSLTRSRTRRGVNGNASEWLGAVEGLAPVHARLRPVVLECMDAVKLIRREDTAQTFFYCDPPYLHETRASTDLYAHEMTYAQHRELLDALKGLKGKFILSGYDNDLYRGYANTAPRWRRVDFDMANHAAGGVTKRRMVESLWMNYPESDEAARG